MHLIHWGIPYSSAYSMYRWTENKTITVFVFLYKMYFSFLQHIHAKKEHSFVTKQSVSPTIGAVMVQMTVKMVMMKLHVVSSGLTFTFDLGR